MPFIAFQAFTVNFCKICVSVKHRNTETQSFVLITFLCFYSLLSISKHSDDSGFLQKTVFQWKTVEHWNTVKHIETQFFCKKFTVYCQTFHANTRLNTSYHCYAYRSIYTINLYNQFIQLINAIWLWFIMNYEIW